MNAKQVVDQWYAEHINVAPYVNHVEAHKLLLIKAEALKSALAAAKDDPVSAVLKWKLDNLHNSALGEATGLWNHFVTTSLAALLKAVSPTK